MPMRDEFIERAVRQLAAALARLTGLDRAAAVDQADLSALRAQVESLYPAFLGTSSALVDLLGIDDLLGVIGSAGYVDGERAYLLSALLETEAEIEQAAARVEAVGTQGAARTAKVDRLKERALILVLEAGAAGLGESDIAERVARLAGALPPERLDGAHWERVHRSSLARGDFAAAEDALFEWFEHAPDSSELVAERGAAFYGELARLKDEELEAGGLPRVELGEGRADLEARLLDATEPRHHEQ